MSKRIAACNESFVRNVLRRELNAAYGKPLPRAKIVRAFRSLTRCDVKPLLAKLSARHLLRKVRGGIAFTQPGWAWARGDMALNGSRRGR